MVAPQYDALVRHLDSRFGDHLRWVASFDSERYTYDVKYVRADLKTELSDRDLQTIIHRSMAVFNRDHVDDVYFHLGEVQSLLLEHEEAMAFHLYLGDSTGVVVKLAAGVDVQLPELREECLAALGVE